MKHAFTVFSLVLLVSVALLTGCSKKGDLTLNVDVTLDVIDESLLGTWQQDTDSLSTSVQIIFEKDSAFVPYFGWLDWRVEQDKIIFFEEVEQHNIILYHTAFYMLWWRNNKHTLDISFPALNKALTLYEK